MSAGRWALRKRRRRAGPPDGAPTACGDRSFPDPRRGGLGRLGEAGHLRGKLGLAAIFVTDSGRSQSRQLGHDLRGEPLDLLCVVNEGVEQDHLRSRGDHVAQTGEAFGGRSRDGDG